VIIEFEFFGINKMILKAFNVHFIEYLLKSKLNLKKAISLAWLKFKIVAYFQLFTC
jgi:hypothetical protein